MESSVLYFSSSVCHFHPDNNILLFTQWYTLLCLAGKKWKTKEKKNGIMSRQEHHAQRAINKTGSTHHCSDFFKSTACLPSTAVANVATFSPDLATFWEPFSDWTSNKGQATNLVTISVGISYFLAPTQSSPDHISRRLWSWLKHETWTASAKSTLTDLEEYFDVLSLSSFHYLIPQRNYSSVHGKHSVSNIRHSSLDDTWLHTIVLPSENRIQSKLNLNTF